MLSKEEIVMIGTDDSEGLAVSKESFEEMNITWELQWRIKCFRLVISRKIMKDLASIAGDLEEVAIEGENKKYRTTSIFAS